MSANIRDRRQRASTSELICALEEALSRPIHNIERRPYQFGSSFELEELLIDLDDGERLNVMFKNLSWSSLTPEGCRAKPGFLYDAAREIDVYRFLLVNKRQGTPIYYGSVVDPAQDRFWLFTEKVDGAELFQVGDMDQWEEAGRWLAHFHWDFQQTESSLPGELKSRLVHYDEAYYRQWMGRAQSFQGQNRLAKVELNRLAQRYDKVVDILLSLPTTVVHGEFYASNILACRSHRICPVDWEMTGIGPGLIDLAALMSGNWSSERRLRIAKAYFEHVHQSQRPNFPEFWRLCQFCRLHLAIQWLGWSPDWSPPADHQHDWLSEALNLAEELELSAP